MDSIRTEVHDFYAGLGTKIVDESHDQDTTDLHKCVAFIRDCTPNLEKANLCILVAGALGGRFDHEAGNINILYRFPTMRIILISDDCLIHLLPRTHHHEICIQSSVEGPHCGLIPIGFPSGSTSTTGLQWDLNNTEMSFGGLLPLSLLKTAQGHPMLVELKNGETYNGHLVNCDTWMNIHLREVICTSKDGDRFWRMPECYIRGNTIKYLRVPDEVIDKVQEETKARSDRKPPGVGRGRGRGREDVAGGRGAKGIGRGFDDGGAKGVAGRGRGGSSGKPGGNRGGGRGRG
ncbi:putative U6 snRNA-associated Sm-like protein LSm4 [Tripterygium wilfordii]|uniref:thiamine diphosphokinase n=1 Tax=Tripterygium wilfordii TaxID=458696 RepID=A0A7J7CBI2_TRIWF|nr:putative U6 snRNA-associated Sm-like protein LSm4 [Tripterygium wilfordii]